MKASWEAFIETYNINACLFTSQKPYLEFFRNMENADMCEQTRNE